MSSSFCCIHLYIVLQLITWYVMTKNDVLFSHVLSVSQKIAEVGSTIN